jgi:YfiH family protein
VRRRKDTIEYITSSLLDSHKGITHSFLTRKGGISSHPFDSLNFSSHEGDRLENIQENKKLVAQAFGFSLSSLITLNQVHGNDVIVIDAPPLNRQFEGDAMITNQKGLTLGILTADCLPILMKDSSEGIIGAVHAGWKGTSLRIVQEALISMEHFFGVQAYDVTVVLGPSIGVCCYEVDNKVLKHMRKNLPREMAPPSKRMLDLIDINRKLLLEMGVKDDSIECLNFCTACREDLFFSYRRDRITGRQLSFIMLD